MLDLLIRGATVVDGTGQPSRRADIGVVGKTLVFPSKNEKAGKTIDADGLALMPGIVDVHTHFDAQVTWDPTLSPSVSLGVTTVVMGNCGFGLAPCPPAERETVLRNLSVVEGMDLDALLAGTRWSFETFPEYLQALRAIGPYGNVAVLAQHSTIRTAVLGESASSLSNVSDSQLEEMKTHVRQAMDAGAIGFASSFSPNHSGWAGRPMPSTIATDAELGSLVGVLGEKNRGIFVIASGPRATPEYLEDIAARTGRPAFMVTVLTMYNRAAPGKAIEYYEKCRAALSRGREVYIHTSCQPLSFDFTLRDPYLLYSHGAFAPVKAASPRDRGAIYRSSSFRQAFRQNLESPGAGILFYGDWSQVEQDGVPVTELAARAGKDPLDYVFDLPLDTQLVAKLFQNDDAGVAPLLKDPAGVIALSDAGAHLVYFCDAGFGLHFLQHWVRETGTFALEEGVRRLTSDPAAKYRIPNRGLIREGFPADMVLFDPSAVGVSGLKRTRDLPGGGTRMIREPVGVHGVWVNGTQVHDGTATASLARGPGEVLTRFDSR